MCAFALKHSFIGGLMSYLCYLYIFTWSVQDDLTIWVSWCVLLQVGTAYSSWAHEFTFSFFYAIQTAHLSFLPPSCVLSLSLLLPSCLSLLPPSCVLSLSCLRPVFCLSLLPPSYNLSFSLASVLCFVSLASVLSLSLSYLHPVFCLSLSCLRPVFCLPNIDSVSGLSITDYSFVLL